MSYNNNTHHCQNENRDSFTQQGDSVVSKSHHRSVMKDDKREQTERVQRLYKDFLNNL